jgi:WD40 repeat protein
VRVPCLTVFIVASLLFCSSVFCLEPSLEPILRLETGAHTGRIYSLAADGEGKYVVSASMDKTVRIWASKSGKLLSVLRPPIGDDMEGELYAMTLSPDGKTIACAGYTGKDWGERSIYLFDIATGRLQRRLTAGLTEYVLSLAYSRDGKYLAALQPFRNGLALYRISDGKLIGQDFSYRGRWGSIDFAPHDKDGIIHFATASEDGYIRLYELKHDSISPSFRIIKHEKARNGNRPLLVRYSPDGLTLAVSYGDVRKVDVMSARDLSYLYSPETTGVTGDIPIVQWSRDGTALYCGGGWRNARDRVVLRRWLDRGKGPYNDIGIGTSRITDIVTLPDNTVVVGTYSGWMMAADDTNKVRVFSGVRRPDFRDNPLYLSSDGATIRFGFQKEGKSPVLFSLPAHALTAHDPGKSQEKLSGPITQAEDVKVTDWNETKEPRINGKRIRTFTFETSYSFALTPDHQGILHGTSRYLRLLTKETEEKWKVPVGGTVMTVTASPDGRLAVAALSDGTISWFRLTDGKLLLSLLAHGDQKRWVVWSPSGYYDCSEGADELLGWHVNNGRDREALFYPLARFFERFFRPDVITAVITGAEPDSKVIASMKEAAPARPVPAPGQVVPDDARVEMPILKLAQELPPQVAILSPANNATLEKEQLQVTVEAKDMGGGVSEVRLFHNGKRVLEDGKNTVIVQKGKNIEKTYSLALLEGENVIMAVALSTDTIEGNPAEIAVMRKGESKAPDLHLVLVGIDKYKNPALNLNFAGLDTASIREFFTSPPARRLFANIHVHAILNEKATREGVTALFNELKQQAQQKDVIVLYMAGHGDMVGSEWFFIPYDVTTPEEETVVKKMGISAKEITEALRAFKAQKIFVILDACKSGGLISGITGLRGYEDRKVMKQLVRSTGTYVVSASTDKQYAAELKDLSHGVLTYTMLEGLHGKAGEGKVTVEGLIQYVKDRLPEVTEKYRGTPQWPVSWGAGMDFPLALY